MPGESINVGCDDAFTIYLKTIYFYRCACITKIYPKFKKSLFYKFSKSFLLYLYNIFYYSASGVILR